MAARSEDAHAGWRFFKFSIEWHAPDPPVSSRKHHRLKALSNWPRKQAQRLTLIEEFILLGAMIGFLAIGVEVIVNGLRQVVCYYTAITHYTASPQIPPHGWCRGFGAQGRMHVGTLASNLISDGLLVIILLEIMETIRKQLQQEHRRLSSTLVRNFLVIGLVSVVRHILALGARLALQQNGVKPLDLWELGVSAGVLLVLTIGLNMIPETSEPEGAGLLGPDHSSTR